MARKPRVHFPGATNHVMLRGSGGQPVFDSESDFQEFENLLEDGVNRFYHRVMITYLGVKHSKNNLKEISERLKVNHSSLSRGSHRFIEKMIQDKSLREVVEEIEKSF